MKLTIPAPAKLNLFLHILGQRDDGYHMLESAMQFVDWCDTLTFEPLSNGEIQLHSNYDEIPAADNLVVRAAEALRTLSNVQHGVRITLDKQLPSGAGLGGGSSDAATTLLALNHLWVLDLPFDTLMQLGEALGADVPFFIYGQAGWVTGIGEQIAALALPQPWYLLVLPDCAIETARLFQDSGLKRDCATLDSTRYEIGQGTNVFLPVVLARYPEIKQAADWLSQYAAVRLTGTGSTLFAVFDTAHEAGRIASLAPEGLRCVVTQGLNQSPAQVALSEQWGVAKW